jgi:hypothetical protein
VRLQFTVSLNDFRFRRGVVILVIVVVFCVFNSVLYFVPTFRRSLLPPFSG